MRKLKVYLKLFFGTTFLLYLTGCGSLMSKVGGKFPPDSMASIGNDEILVVGKIELFPPLKKSEQDVYSTATKAFVNKALIVTDEEVQDVRNITPSGFSIRHVAATELGKTFFYEEDFSDPLIYSGGFVQMKYYSYGSGYRETTIVENKLMLPGGLKFTPNKSDKAIYIGTIQYYRDENNNITSIKLKDEYEEANEIFKKKYNSSVKLAKVKPVKFKM